MSIWTLKKLNMEDVILTESSGKGRFQNVLFYLRPRSYNVGSMEISEKRGFKIQGKGYAKELK